MLKQIHVLLSSKFDVFLHFCIVVCEDGSDCCDDDVGLQAYNRGLENSDDDLTSCSQFVIFASGDLSFHNLKKYRENLRFPLKSLSNALIYLNYLVNIDFVFQIVQD